MVCKMNNVSHIFIKDENSFVAGSVQFCDICAGNPVRVCLPKNDSLNT